MYGNRYLLSYPNVGVNNAQGTWIEIKGVKGYVKRSTAKRHRPWLYNTKADLKKGASNPQPAPEKEWNPNNFGDFCLC